MGDQVEESGSGALRLAESRPAAESPDDDEEHSRPHPHDHRLCGPGGPGAPPESTEFVPGTARRPPPGQQHRRRDHGDDERLLHEQQSHDRRQRGPDRMPAVAGPGEQNHLRHRPGRRRGEREHVQGRGPPRARGQPQRNCQARDQREQECRPAPQQHPQHTGVGGPGEELQHRDLRERHPEIQWCGVRGEPGERHAAGHEVAVVVGEKELRGRPRVAGGQAVQDQVVPVEPARGRDPDPHEHGQYHDRRTQSGERAGGHRCMRGPGAARGSGGVRGLGGVRGPARRQIPAVRRALVGGRHRGSEYPLLIMNSRARLGGGGSS